MRTDHCSSGGCGHLRRGWEGRCAVYHVGLSGSVLSSQHPRGSWVWPLQRPPSWNTRSPAPATPGGLEGWEVLTEVRVRVGAGTPETSDGGNAPSSLWHQETKKWRGKLMTYNPVPETSYLALSALNTERKQAFGSGRSWHVSQSRPQAGTGSAQGQAWRGSLRAPHYPHTQGTAC